MVQFCIYFVSMLEVFVNIAAYSQLLAAILGFISLPLIVPCCEVRQGITFVSGVLVWGFFFTGGSVYFSVSV